MTKPLKFSDNPGQNILAKILFFSVTQPTSEKKTFPPVAVIRPAALNNKNNIDSWGKGKFLVFTTIFV